MTFWEPYVIFRTFTKKIEWTFELREPVLGISLAKPTHNVKTILKKCELFTYLFIYDVTNFSCRNVLKTVAL